MQPMGDVTASVTLDVSPAPASAVSVDPDAILAQAIAALQRDRDTLAEVLEQLPAPIYLTDADGVVLHFNSACVNFAGRTPVPGEDRWCVTWRLYDEAGVFLPHDRCPMAVAIGERRPVRGAVAVAERPDGRRVMFTPYPTPIFGADGELVGAVNLLLDITDQRQAVALRAQAQRCRRLAQSVMDQRTIDTLLVMAAEYEAKAETLGTG